MRRGDRGDELVAAPWDIDDEPISVPPVTQRAAQCRDLDGQIGMPDKDIGPDAIHQFLLADQITCALEQDDQDFQSTTSEGNRLVAVQQKKFRREQAKRAK